MKISYNWLKDYVNTSLNPDELDNLLTFSGLEIEGVEKVETIKGGLEHVVIAKVLTCEPHPDSDHLHLTTVDVGKGEPLHIVCGAPNVAAGQKVVCAQIGTKIWSSDTEYHEIKKGKLRGAVSEGMLCAEDELQLGNSHDGIMVLPDDAPVGMPARDYFNVKDDYTLEVAITANRSDATSHIGVARDVVAVLNTRKTAEGNDGDRVAIKWPEVDNSLTVNQHPAVTGAQPIKVTVEEPELCPRYSGLTIRNVHVQESPDWLKDKLRTIGLRPINNIVDITNFILMEVGQPLHAFDADMIEGGHVVVRRLPQDTPFVTLDGVERKLDNRDLMICNEKEGMCIAGVFGGEKSGVTMQTHNVFIESAYFNPVSIRKTSKRHGLKTDASFRYERGCDPNITLWAVRRAAKLIQELAGGEVCGDIVDIYPKPIEKAQVDINFKRVADLIGKEIPLPVIRTALTSLDIEIAAEDSEGMKLLIPTCKVDVYRECDVVEEIMRIYGYNNIEFDERLNSCLAYGTKPNPQKLKNIASDYLTCNGFNEIMNNSLTKSGYYEGNADFPLEHCVTIINPLSKELNVMRQTLLYGGLECIVSNMNHKIFDQKIYEFGRSYVKNAVPEGDDAASLSVTKRYSETQHLTLFMTGMMQGESWRAKTTPVDFFDAKALLVNILNRLRVPMGRLQAVPATEHFLAEGLSYQFKDNKKQIAVVGRISRETLKRMDCKQEVIYADIDWDLLLKSIPTKDVTFSEIAKFPEVRRDLALVLDNAITFAQIEEVARNTEKKLLKRVSLFDVYQGKGIADGFKSYAVSFILQDADRTLNDKQIEAVMAKLQKNFETQLGAKIRV
ncbi:MAG: phenylalanine--tRNA ligase subunit beta [Bacteroidales bacterium]|nr:phenylalanine--tRNA ligase subunit beta [Bacteroidales bacterium]